jgi:hypothetical protein
MTERDFNSGAFLQIEVARAPCHPTQELLDPPRKDTDHD